MTARPLSKMADTPRALGLRPDLTANTHVLSQARPSSLVPLPLSPFLFRPDELLPLAFPHRGPVEHGSNGSNAMWQRGSGPCRAREETICYDPDPSSSQS